VVETQLTVDLTNCDREPIHVLGAIQRIGFLISITKDWLVSRASENVSQFLGCSPEDMIGRPLAEFVSARAVHDLRNRVAMLRGPDAVERLFASELVKDAHFDVAVHISGSFIIIEAEPGSQAIGDTTGTVRSMIARLDLAPDLQAFYREGARQIRALLAYDRVMVYKFDKDGSGEVVGEVCKSGIGTFKGLRYPASDIPQQARTLYKRNLLRLIADIGATPVPISPQLDEAGNPLDLSLSMLRSVSPIHIEYLRNMGVCASLSISIIVEGELWGLFACHHYSPRTPSFQMRSVSELFAQMFAMRLESRERRAVVEYERRARDISDQLLGAVASDETLLKDPDWLADILTHAIQADGVGVWINGSYAFSGTTPPTEFFKKIVRALNGTRNSRVA
jgi:light-regulated signal transduction histidine kinase (bacteriophytochrome)